MGDNATQIDDIIKKHQAMIKETKSSEVAKEIGWKWFMGVLWSLIRYRLPSYVISVNESDRIIRKSFRPLFNSMNIHSNFPRQVTVLPTYFLGLKIPNPYVDCGVVIIIMFINNMGSEILNLKFLTYTLQFLQIETRKREDILLQSYNKLKKLGNQFVDQVALGVCMQPKDRHEIAKATYSFKNQDKR